jgi:outer membrane biosynthesis protein TonB
MNDLLIFLLLFLALIVPFAGALLLRIFAPRLGERRFLIGAALVFGLAMAGALALSRSDVAALRVGDLTLLLSGTRRSAPVPLPPDIVPFDGDLETPPAAPPVPPTLTPRPSATPTPSPSPEPSSTPSPTLEPTPEPTVEPPPEPTPEPPPAAGPRTYTVQPGDSLRAIAEQFGVSVQAILDANNLTPAQGDALQVGQELIIP